MVRGIERLTPEITADLLARFAQDVAVAGTIESIGTSATSQRMELLLLPNSEEPPHANASVRT
jgi:translation initiation factor IF-3